MKPTSTQGLLALVVTLMVAMGFVALRTQCSTTAVGDFNMAQVKADGIQAILETMVDSSTGTLFEGNAFRTFQNPRNFEAGGNEKKKNLNTNQPVIPGKQLTRKCQHWAVVTTIFEPSEAVKRTAALPAASGWCTVIVADTKTPTNYREASKLTPAQEEGVVFLSVDDQKAWAASASGVVGEFVRSIPYRHFARKNLGFLYAIQQGAQFVFDFDDDNILYYWDAATREVMLPLEDPDKLLAVRIPETNQSPTHSFNHHLLMGATIEMSWARGFPLELVQDTKTQGLPLVTQDRTIPMSQLAVLQYCAEGNPDIDAIHRLVKPLPMGFQSREQGGTPLLVPQGVYSPYNAQATVHTAPALFALLLPFTVPGRVSDIWRGYFAQRIFDDLDLHLAFLPPAIVQDRNEHSYLADMKAELDLYFKTGKLVDFLSKEWTSKATTVPERMEALWIALYERGYIEENDVTLVQLWLGALVESGYQFPPLVSSHHADEFQAHQPRDITTKGGVDAEP